MYRVEMTEREVRELGVSRQAQKYWKRKVATFVVGLLACCVGAWLWELVIGKVLLFGCGTLWVAYTFYQSRKDSRAGDNFLAQVKDADNNN